MCLEVKYFDETFIIWEEILMCHNKLCEILYFQLQVLKIVWLKMYSLSSVSHHWSRELLYGLEILNSGTNFLIHHNYIKIIFERHR